MIWKKYSLENEIVYYWHLGAVEFYIKKNNKEWQIAYKHNASVNNLTELAREVPEPVDVKWNTFIGDRQSPLILMPALPDRPVVVKPDNIFKLLPDKIFQLFIHMPVWIQLYLGAPHSDNLICEIPSAELSGTWFGDSDSGVLSYSLPKGYIKNSVLPSMAENEIICPLRITNSSSSQLDFQRLCIHVESLNIYSQGKTLMANETKVRFKGENFISDIYYTDQAPANIENLKLIADPRIPGKANVLKKSFHFFKSLTEY